MSTLKSLLQFILVAVLLLQVVFAQSWESHTAMTSKSFQSTFNSLSKKGYTMADVDGFVINNAVYYSGIWQKVSANSYVRFGMTSSQYQKYLTDLSKKGYRPKKVSGYNIGGSDRYAAVWVKASGPAWVARHGLTSSAYQTAFNSYVKQGYRLRHVSGYGSGNSVRYASVWEKTGGPAWASRSGLSASMFQSALNSYNKKGYRLTMIDVYTVGSNTLYSGIWEKSSGTWVARYGMNSKQFQSYMNTYVAQGYRVVNISGYGTKTAYYAALWAK
ncbi:hypothetical protein BGZ76_000803 [Entomortierella beljakovae]|nr:hypothetical protein BGZ76_000803 [Entomortierella beljakovae]